MDQHFQSPPNEIKRFLNDLRKLIDNKEFDYKKHFILKDRLDDMSNEMHNNKNTLLLLNYRTEDIIRELKNLTIDDYYETIIDTVGNEVLLYAFIKKIKEEKIYIKLTIRNNKIILCYSFHISSK